MPSHNDQAQFTGLPDEIVQRIALFLDPHSLLQLSLTCPNVLRMLSEPGFLPGLINAHLGFSEKQSMEMLRFSNYSHMVRDYYGSGRMAKLFFSIRHESLEAIQALEISGEELFVVNKEGESLLSIARARGDQKIIDYLWQTNKLPKSILSKAKLFAFHKSLKPNQITPSIGDGSDYLFRILVCERNIEALLTWHVAIISRHGSSTFADEIIPVLSAYFLRRTSPHLQQIGDLRELFESEQWHGEAIKLDVALCVLLREHAAFSKLTHDTSDVWACAKLSAWCGNEFALNFFLESIKKKDIQAALASTVMASVPTSRECAVVLLHQGADINAQNTESETALLHAIKTNQAVLVRYLLEQGACASEPLGQPAKLPLHWAIDELQCDALRALLDSGVAVSNADAVRFIQRLARCESEEKSRVCHVAPILIRLLGLSDQRDLPQEALYSRLRECLKAHWPQNANSAWGQVSVFNFAASTNDAGLLRLVVTPELSKTLQSTSPTGLCHAAECASTEAIKLLHKLGHDVNAVSPSDKRKRSPIFFAIKGGTERTWSPDRYAPVIKLLASLGGNLCQRNSQDETPLSLAYKTSPVGLVQALLEALQKWEPSPGAALAEIKRVHERYTTTRVGNQRALEAAISKLEQSQANAAVKRSGSAAGLAGPAPTRVASSHFHQPQASASSSQSLPSSTQSASTLPSTLRP